MRNAKKKRIRNTLLVNFPRAIINGNGIRSKIKTRIDNAGGIVPFFSRKEHKPMRTVTEAMKASSLNYMGIVYAYMDKYITKNTYKTW